MNNQEQTINHLNDLLTRNYDAEAGYKQAAEKVENPQLKTFLQNRATQRYDFGHELKNEIKNLGGDPEKGTSFQADMHRAWIGMKDALTSGDEAICEECVRGEKSFVEEYEEALRDSQHMPNSVTNLIQNQLTNAKNALNEVEQMKDFSK